MARSPKSDATRTETDSFGPIEVPSDRYWGAQTQRSRQNFRIGNDRMPMAIIHALGIVKLASAETNRELGLLDNRRAGAIARAAREVIEGKLDDHFPLVVWQTGSGTQTNMNLNEVIANRANELLGGKLGAKEPVHPNDHVNMSQSSNDSFPTAMHIAAARNITADLIPALAELHRALRQKEKSFSRIVKIGRTHLEDATPRTVGQEWSGYVGALDDAIADVEHATRGLLKLAMGGTAVGTGLNAPAGFGEEVAAEIASMTGAPYQTAANKFTSQGTLERMVRAHAGLKSAAVTLFKIANDLRWLGSGPRTGIHELIFPSNEGISRPLPSRMLVRSCASLRRPCQAEAVKLGISGCPPRAGLPVPSAPWHFAQRCWNNSRMRVLRRSSSRM